MTLHPLSLRPVALAILAGLVLSDVALAGDDDTPLYLSLAHSITRDSNFSRDEQKQGETVNTTALQVGINKAYGRQLYRGSARLSKSSYAHYGDLLNNDGKNLNGTVSTGLLSNWLVTVGGVYTENLNKIQDNNAQERIVRNIRTYRNGNVAVQYGVGGLINVVANYDANRVNYTALTSQYNNSTQHSNGLKVIYNSTDMLNFGIGQRLVRTHFPNNLQNDAQSDNNIDLFANWQLTGLSQINGVLTRRRSVYSGDDQRTVRGWTGNVNWRYTPDGVWAYGVGLTRQSGADRQLETWTVQKNVQSTGTTVVNNYLNELTTILNLNARMQATGKLAFTGGYNLARYSRDNGYLFEGQFAGQSSSQQGSSLTRTLSLGADYEVSRSVNLGCSYQRYKQTAGATRVGFEGHSVDCSASLLVD